MTGATFNLNIETVSLRRLGPAFSELMMRMGNLSQPMDEIGAALVDSTHHRFATSMDPDGTPWAPSQRALADGGKTLVDTRRLESSITHFGTHNSVEVGTNVIYAGIHQFGGRIDKHAASMPIHRKQADLKAGLPSRFVKASQSDFMSYHEVGAHSIEMPAREFLGVDDKDANEIEAIIDDWLARPFR